MKKNLIIAGIIGALTTGTISYSYTMTFSFSDGVAEPPVSYINNLKNCTKSTFTNKGGAVQEYTIKGLLPNDRCEVYMSVYTNYADPKVYELIKTMREDSDISSQQEMLERAKENKWITVCKLSKFDREALYNAYQKHDNSYNQLMFKMENGPCTSYSKNIPATAQEKKYACEYADTTCYYSSSSGQMSCTKETPSNPKQYFEISDKVQKHIKAGLCEQL